VPALFPLHVDRDYRMRRRHQPQDVKNQPENRAKHDQDQIENRRKGLPVQKQPERRQQGSEDVDHRQISGGVQDYCHADLGGFRSSAMAGFVGAAVKYR